MRRVPPRQSAMLAKQRISNMNSVHTNNINELPTHGWDFKTMMELALLDDEDIYILQPHRELLIDADDNTDSSRSPTADSSTESYTDSDTEVEDLPDDYNEENPHNDATNASHGPANFPWQPITPPRLPTNLNTRQDLTETLNHPEVQCAIAEDQYLNQPQRIDVQSPDVTQEPRPTRRTRQPRNYALYHGTGKK